MWPALADKFSVREYVKSKGLESILVPLIGVWDNALQIDFDSLPEECILKCTHDSGSYHIIKKALGYDKEAIINDLNLHLKHKFGYSHCEPHYNRIRPRIIAEKLLFSESDKAFSSSLVDYKVWCFHGVPYCIFVCYGRDKDILYVNVYDLDWNVHPEYSVFSDHYQDGRGVVQKPSALSQILNYASKLSEGFPEARVDFYIIEDRVYFGEITFTSNYGQMDYFTKEYLVELGRQIVL